ncbi:hypothetical protein PROFUN_02652 [Planoprotostelium fungivorum]|uniref:F-box domain-containing protein n=1 Tax=Planoprotostelium fungivorum TaxID=1890364 RepID=A0A2P6NVC4_9EUKA|nr:hypothetical protein PROFUN_02652 [Planoprotostelium fungivorum]
MPSPITSMLSLFKKKRERSALEQGLPYDCLFLILRQLDVEDLDQAMNVCVLWRRIIVRFYQPHKPYQGKLPIESAIASRNVQFIDRLLRHPKVTITADLMLQSMDMEDVRDELLKRYNGEWTHSFTNTVIHYAQRNSWTMGYKKAITCGDRQSVINAFVGVVNSHWTEHVDFFEECKFYKPSIKQSDVAFIVQHSKYNLFLHHQDLYRKIYNNMQSCDITISLV